MKKIAGLLAVALMTTGLVSVSSAAGTSTNARYVVLAKSGVDQRDVRAALASLTERIVKRNHAIGLATVVAGPDFVREALETGLFYGVARDRVIGHRPQEVEGIGERVPIDRPTATHAPFRRASHLGEDTLFRYQWTMRQVNVGPSDSYLLDKGNPDVLVGVLDDGISAGHPDIGPNFNEELSRNFTTDIPSIDGPCASEKDDSCADPATVSEGGHGTWVATTIAGAHNGRGISGVAPDVSLVNLRAGQDSGYFFLQPVVDALTYAGDVGVDVANMSFFVDPWLYNCTDNPADSDAAQQEQRTVIEATQRALDYARDRGVTLISAAGNEFTDLGEPSLDLSSPNYPPGNEYRREVDNSCIQVPTESEGVIPVSGTGPSGRKAWYSNYGVEQTVVAVPGGDTFDKALPFPYNGALAGWSRSGLADFGLINKKGKPLSPDVLRRCKLVDKKKKQCGYYVFFEGTSVAAPVAVGVAALIVGRFGEDDGDGGVTMDPALVEDMLIASAVPHECPEGGVQEYPEVGRTLEPFGISEDDLRAECDEGDGDFNGFYGHGIVSARKALELTGP